ncbi:MAG: serine/threonine protein kinase, partial [Acidobacteriales bacterium]|nr:serine/threonine protein kinase [Terriglobales bacterium]
VRVLHDIGAALDYAHSRDVIHRDVKPSNIMVDNTGRALLADFGLALLADIGTRGEVLGSPHYVAPEQTVSSSNVVPQTDLYSLGISLFEMLTGDVPFTGDQLLDVAMRHISDPVPPPSQLNGVIPPSVDDVVLRALEKEPYERYQTGAEMATAFQQAVQNWQENQHRPSNVVRRPSLVLLPQKVQSHLQTAEDAPANTPAVKTTATTPPAEVPTRTAQNVPHTTEIAGTAQPKSAWRGALVFSALVFIIGLVVVLALIASRGGNTAPTPTEQAEVAVVPSETSVEITPTSVMEITEVAAPTTLPTEVPVEVVPVPTYTARYALLISRQGDNSLFVMNLTLDPFPLAPLRLGTDNASVSGSEWGLEQLGNGTCVTVWRTSGNFLSPDVLCAVVGTHVPRDEAQVFWGGAFGVYYNDVLVATCDQTNCLVRIDL